MNRHDPSKPLPTPGGPVSLEPRYEPRRRWRALEAVAIFAIGVGLMHSIYAGAPQTDSAATRTDTSDPGVPGHDSFYHIKMAAMIPQHGLIEEFPWLRFTYFTEDDRSFVGHHYGFHVLLMPFVHLAKVLTGDYLPGGRWAMQFIFGANLLLFDLLLLTLGTRWRWLWLLLFLFMPFQFFVRHTYVRAIGPSLMLMQLILLFMFRRRYLLTGLAVAAYTHLYLGGVVYAPLLVGLYFFAIILSRSKQQTLPWRLLIWSAAGWSAGVLTHPYAHGMFDFLRMQIFGSGLSPDISVGQEWKPYADVWWFVQMSGVVLIVWIVALGARLRFGGSLDPRGWLLLLLNLAFLILTCKARRFVEYWPIFGLLSAATLSQPLIEKLVTWSSGGRVPSAAPASTSIASSSESSASRRRRPWRWRAGLALQFVIVAVSLTATIYFARGPWRAVQQAARCGYDLAAIGETMEFVIAHSEPGEVIFTDDWDIFPVFFYYNSHNHYIVGMDPKFTHARRPDLWERYVRISRGQVAANETVRMPGESGETLDQQIHIRLEDIRDHFGASFVITDRDHKSLAAKLSANEDLAELLYPSASYKESRDAPYLVFRVQELAATDS